MLELLQVLDTLMFCSIELYWWFAQAEASPVKAMVEMFRASKTLEINQI